MIDWIELDDYWDEIVEKSDNIKRLKKHYSSGKHYNNNTDLVGLAGQYIITHLTGIKIDDSLMVGGQPNSDLEDEKVEIKTTTYHKSPMLIEFPDKKTDALYYVLVAMEMSKKRGYVAGHCTTEELMSTELVDFGYGERNCLSYKKMRQGLPEVITKQ